MTAQAPGNPTLPQDDTPAQQQARMAQLARAQTVYAWTTDVLSLPGVPLSATLPGEDVPTLTWWLLLIQTGLDIARNVLAHKLANTEGEFAIFDKVVVEAESALCDKIAADVAVILAKIAASHPATEAGIIADIELAGKAVIEEVEVAALRDNAAKLQEIITLSNAELASFGTSKTRDLSDYRDLFKTLALPPIGWTFIEDSEFARLRVAGPNSAMIEQITALPNNFPVTEGQYAGVVANDTLSVALADGRLFLCDYAPLKTIEPGVWDGQAKYIYCPLALFARPPGAASLVPVAIQCDQDSSVNPIFTPTLSAEGQWGWELAKFTVQVADGNYHELYAHLARTHLVTEAIAVATHRQLAEQHPIWALLMPHFEGTLFINEAAATSLITAGGPIDHIFAGTIVSSQTTAVDARLSFNFTDKMLPADLAARGLADQAVLPDYPYRDDALLVWNAIAGWAGEYVALYYTNDAAVTGDTELAKWAAEITTKGGVKGFAAPQTIPELVQCCTMIIFTASAQHAAVNFPQATVMAFAPAVTGAGWQSAPVQTSGSTKADLLALMPPVGLSLEQLNVLHLLGSIHYRPLGQYLSVDFPYPAWFTDPKVVGTEGALPRFQAGLAAVERDIVEANSNRRVPYPYLQPSLIPTSTNI